MKEVIKSYKEIFKIPEDLEVKVRFEKSNECLYYPHENKAIIKVAQIEDLDESFAQLKLGIMYSPLLSTLFFQKELSPEEQKLAARFYYLSYPILSAWTWQIMRMYLPGERYRKAMEETLKMYEDLVLTKMLSKIKPDYMTNTAIPIALYLVLKDAGMNPKIKPIGKENVKFYVKYIKLLEEMLDKTPSPELLIELAKKTDFPAEVSIEKDKETGIEYFLIKEK
ncbi:MAG: hypothetical protein QXX30_04125 [Candidatus Aenigmatarchaeota archaeon]